MITNENVKDKFKNIEPSVLESFNLLTKARIDGYVCPHCGAGSHENGTGFNFSHLPRGWQGYCFSCGRTVDVFDLVGEKYHLNPLHDFLRILEETKRLFGEAPLPAQKKNDFTKLQKPRVNHENFIRLAQSMLPEFINLFRSKTYRGLTLDDYRFFGCGWVDNWVKRAASVQDSDNGMDGAPRLIIPTDFYHYLARAVAAGENKPKVHRGQKNVFGFQQAKAALEENPNQIIFATEGEINAISIHHFGFTAIAFCGSSILDNQLAQLQNLPAGTKIILAFDADETGIKKTPAAEKLLTESGFRLYANPLGADEADLNDILTQNPENARVLLQKVYADATKYFANNLDKKVEPPKETPPEKTEHVTTAQAIPSCPVDLKIPNEYEMSREKIVKLSTSARGKVDPQTVTLTPIVPVQIIQLHDRSETLIKIAVYDRHNKVWYPHTVPLKTLSKSTEILDLASFGVNVTSLTAPRLSQFITNILNESDNPVRIPKLPLYDQTGWTDRQCETYIYPAGDGKYVVNIGSFDFDNAYRTEGDKDLWVKTFCEAVTPDPQWVKDIRAGVRATVRRRNRSNILARYACGLVLAAPLVRVLNIRNLQGVLIAKSGSGKSAVVRLAMSIFGDTEKLKKTFDGTPKFADGIVRLSNDLPCWIDEFQSANKTVRESLNTMVYNFAEGKTRGRLTKNGDIRKQFEFHGSRIMTAEQPLLTEGVTEGAHNRLIQIDTTDFIDRSLAIRLHEILLKTFGHFGRAYIDYIKKNKSAIQNTYELLYEHYQTCAKSLAPDHLKNLAAVYTALIHFEELLVLKGEVEQDRLRFKYLARFVDIEEFDYILPDEQGNGLVTRAMNFISELRYTHAKLFQRQDKQLGWITPEGNVKLLGAKFLDSAVAFYPSQLKHILENEGFSSATTVYKALFEAGKIVAKGTDRMPYCKSLYVDGKSQRMIYFPKNSFKDLDTRIDDDYSPDED